MFKSKIARSLTAQSNMKLDPAVVRLLDLNPDKTSVSAAGGGGSSSASTLKITSQLDDGTDQTFFMKTGSGEEAQVMFQGKPNLWHTRAG
jgi:protein-ribulosamine 3-kinase